MRVKAITVEINGHQIEIRNVAKNVVQIEVGGHGSRHTVRDSDEAWDIANMFLRALVGGRRRGANVANVTNSELGEVAQLVGQIADID